MGKKKKIDKNNDKTVKSINNGIRSSVRKINPILKSIVGKKVDVLACLSFLFFSSSATFFCHASS